MSAVERSCRHLEQFEMGIVGTPGLNRFADLRVAKNVGVSGSGGLLNRWIVVLHCWVVSLCSCLQFRVDVCDIEPVVREKCP